MFIGLEDLVGFWYTVYVGLICFWVFGFRVLVGDGLWFYF